MSQTYSIGCRDCKKHLWIGQVLRKQWRIYTSKNHLDALGEFLFAHKGHNLVFDENTEGEILDFEEIETE